MNYYICVDCEGVACTVGSPGVALNGSPDLEFARQQATREANAAARAVLDCGAKRVIIWDAHSGGMNLNYLDLDPRCEIALGSGFPHRCPGIDSSFAGILFIGYHAMAGTTGAVLSHTMSSKLYQSVRVNGREIGEMAIDAAVAGHYGVPPIFAASDDFGIREAEDFFSGIIAVETKKSFGWNACVSLHPLKACEDIYEGVCRALKNERPAVFQFESPLVFERRYQKIEFAEEAAAAESGWERTDAYTLRRTFNSIVDIY